MTARLLRRPPFRFLHDLGIAVLDATGFPVALDDYRDSGVLSEDKYKKLAFVQVLATASDATSVVQPRHVVSGLEPIRTNKLLQAFARAALLHRDKSGSTQASSRLRTKRVECFSFK